MSGNSVQDFPAASSDGDGDARADACRPMAVASSAEQLPPYAGYQSAFHCAFRLELRCMLADVFRAGVGSALDVACGDGTYACWLRELFGAATLVVAVDANLTWLQTSRQRRRKSRRIRQVSADAARLPFEDDSFGAVWCAQSLCSLPDAMAALKEMHRVTATGGTAAVLENDSLHELMLPWPPELELAVREAELTAFRRRSAETGKYYAARFLPQAFQSAGFRSCELKTYALNRTWPLESSVQEFLYGYLAQLRSRIEPYLSNRVLATFDRCLSPAEPTCLFRLPGFSLTCLNHVAFASK